MHRQLYPILLCGSLAAAVVVCLRPSVGQEWFGRTTSGGLPPRPDAAEAPLYQGEASSTGYGNVPQTPYQPTPTSRPASWPGTASRQVFSQAPAPSSPGTPSTVVPAQAMGQPAVPASQWPREESDRQGVYSPWGPNGAGPAKAYPTSWERSQPNEPAPYASWAPPLETRPESHARPRQAAAGAVSARTPQIPPARNAEVPATPWQPPEVPSTPWPGAAGPSAGGVEPPVPNAVPRVAHASRPDASPSPPPTRVQPCEGARILARVGSEVILASEILGSVNEVLVRKKDEIPKEHVDDVRDMLMQQRLKVEIDNRLVYLDAKNSIPEEAFPNVERQLSKLFYSSQLPKMMEVAKVDSRQQLEAYLDQMGTSLQREKEAFIHRSLAQQWLQQEIQGEEKITHEQLLEYYQANLGDYEYPAKVRWEQITVRLSSYPNREEAYRAIAMMGNLVQDGASLAEVAQKGSEGPTADQGGARDWTTKGSLVSETLDRALFGLPVGALSPILEDRGQLHIVRVVERNEAGRVPFVEAQDEITEKIQQQKRQERMKEYLARLREQTPVWTVFDDMPGQTRLSEHATGTRR